MERTATQLSEVWFVGRIRLRSTPSTHSIEEIKPHQGMSAPIQLNADSLHKDHDAPAEDPNACPFLRSFENLLRNRVDRGSTRNSEWFSWWGVQAGDDHTSASR